MGRVNAELAADWVGCLMAQKLGIASPDVEIADVSGEALMTAPGEVRSWAEPGPAFASLQIIGSVAAQSDSQLLEFATPDNIGMMFALDVWLEVLDRKKPDGIWNALVHTSDGGLRVIDFGKCLSPCFFPILGSKVDQPVPNYPLAVRRSGSIQAALEVASRIETMAADDIKEIVTSIPARWIDEEVRQRIADFLVDRSLHLGPVCAQMHERDPKWT